MTKARRSSPASPRSAPMAIPRATIPMSYLRIEPGLRPGRRDPRAVPVRAQSRLARLLRPGSDHGGGNPPQGLRHASGGKDAAAGLPLSIPVACLCREEWIGLPRDSGALESDDLNPATALPRMLWRGAVAFPPARGRAGALDVGRSTVYSGRP